VPFVVRNKSLVVRDTVLVYLKHLKIETRLIDERQRFGYEKNPWTCVYARVRGVSMGWLLV
jgi:hypothetical protein